jgi:hypothetical protein
MSDGSLLELLKVWEKLKFILEELEKMSTSLVNLQSALAANTAELEQLQTDVQSLIAQNGQPTDNPAIDAVTTALEANTAAMSTLDGLVTASLAPPAAAPAPAAPPATVALSSTSVTNSTVSSSSLVTASTPVAAEEKKTNAVTAIPGKAVVSPVKAVSTARQGPYVAPNSAPKKGGPDMIMPGLPRTSPK